MELSGNPAGIPQLGFTHGGLFHADDVFSTAFLKLLRPDIRVYRGLEVPKNFSGIVFDIGDGPFDHHQKNGPKRPGGVPYAAFGLLWREYGKYFLEDEAAQRFDKRFIQPLDLDDNKGTGNILAETINSYNPPWDSDEAVDDAFERAVAVAKDLLSHRLAGIQAAQRGVAVVQAALKGLQDGLVVLDRYVPWKQVLVESAATFVVFPSPRGGYNLQCVPQDYSSRALNKVPLPRAWHGAPVEELVRLSGVNDITFCHASGFMCSVGSVAGAKVLVKIATEENDRRLAEKAIREAAIQAVQAQKQAGDAQGMPVAGAPAGGAKP